MRIRLLVVWCLAACGDDAAPDRATTPREAVCAAQAEHALCLCGALGDVGTLTVRGSLAVNGPSGPHAPLLVERSWLAYGGVTTVADVFVGLDLFTARDARLAGRMTVNRDLVVGGSLLGDADLEVGGTLRVTGVDAHEGHREVHAVGNPQKSPPPACPCELDVAGQIALASGGEVAALPEGETRLGPGTHHFLAPPTMAGRRLVVDGAATVTFDGSLDELGPEQVSLAPGATLEVWASVALYRLRPVPGLRVLVGGSEPMLLSSGEIALYAPAVPVWYAADARISGALVVDSLHGVGPVEVRHAPQAACAAR